MSKPFNILTKSDYTSLSTKETDVMYIITEQNQVSSVEVNSKLIIDYVLVKFYDSTNNNTLLSVVRGQAGEKLTFPIVEPIIQLNGVSEKRYMAFSNWSTSIPSTLVDDLENGCFPDSDTSFYAHRSQLKIINKCEIVLQGEGYQNQQISEKIKLTFKSSKVYIKETKFYDMYFIPVLQYNYETNENNISFHIINYELSELQTSEEFEVPFKIYSDEKMTKLIGEFPFNIKVTTSNESTGD